MIPLKRNTSLKKEAHAVHIKISIFPCPAVFKKRQRIRRKCKKRSCKIHKKNRRLYYPILTTSPKLYPILSRPRPQRSILRCKVTHHSVRKHTSNTPAPLIQPNANPIDNAYCGSFLIQGYQRNTIELWEVGSGSLVTVAQVSIYSSPRNTEILEVVINGIEVTSLYAPPGRTTHFVGSGIQSIHITTMSH
jgi:hypothetical protein